MRFVMPTRESILKFALVGIYALVALKGFELSHFALIKNRANSVLSSAADQERKSPAAAVTDLDRVLPDWYDVAGVRSDAVFAAIEIKRLSGPLKFLALEPEAISVLTVRPMSAQAWDLLAGIRFLRGQSVERAALALQNGLMLGPNEDGLIAERLIYGLILWEHLSSGAKQRIVRDLAIVGDQHAAAELANVRTIITQKDPATRQDIRDRLERIPDRKAPVEVLGF
jgi:hypothetical protein